MGRPSGGAVLTPPARPQVAVPRPLFLTPSQYLACSWQSSCCRLPVVMSTCDGLWTGARADSTADSSSRPTQSRERRQDGSRIDPETAAAAFSETRGTLRRLVTAEETFFAENGTYTDELSHLGLKPDSNTTIRFLRISRDGWAARGTHTSLPGRDCVIFVGRSRRPPTTVKYGRRGREGVPVCDDARASIPQPSPPAAAEPAGRQRLPSLSQRRPTPGMRWTLWTPGCS